MSEGRKRQVYSPEFKARVGLEALKGVKTINEIAQEYGVHPVQVGQWKKAIQEQVKSLPEGQRGPQPVVEHRRPERLYSEIGKLKMELDWLKKSLGSPYHDAPLMGGAGRRTSRGAPVAHTVDIGQGAARDLAANVHMVKPGVLRTKAGLNIPQTFAICQLAKGHAEILIETGKTDDFVMALVTLHAPAKCVHGQVMYDLRENELAFVPRSLPPAKQKEKKYY